MLNSPLADLAQRAETDPDRVLLVDGKERLSYAETYRRAEAVSSSLFALGVKSGDRVGVVMSKGCQQVLAHFGVLAAGAVMVPISDLLKEDQVRYILHDCGIKVVIIDHDKIERLGTDGQTVKILEVGERGSVTSLGQEVGIDLPEQRLDLIGQDNAAIIYSSGSTGMPKGIVLSHRNLWDGARIISAYLGLQSDDRLAQVLSLNFDYGLNQVFGAIHVGAQVHFTTFHFPKDLFSFLETHEITTLALMPVFLNRLFDTHFFKPSFAENISSLRRITSSGGRVSKEIVDVIGQVFPQTDLYLMYGLTEAFRSTYLSPDMVEKHPDSIGKPIPEVQVMVLDEAGNECAPGQYGELVHRGGVVAKGYWNREEKSSERFRLRKDASGNSETVVFSGDIVYRDVEGYLYFVGRNDNLIKTSGHRVSPEEVERATEQMVSVDHAVVFGREHLVLGEEVVLVCINKKGVHPADVMDIKGFLRKKLAAYMIPHRILFHDEFEVTAGNQGKVDRAALKKMVLSELG
jgi:amino acid adenylation domain-containing protein